MSLACCLRQVIVISMSSERGNILLMVLAIVAMIIVMFIGSIGVVSRELHVTVDATQKERAYRIADAGIQYVLFLVGNVGKTPTQLASSPSTGVNGLTRTVTDPITNTDIGSYTLTVSTLSPIDGVDVISLGTNTSGFCSQVKATIKNITGIPGQYLAYGWTRSNCP